jgi:hypothetical protein
VVRDVSPNEHACGGSSVAAGKSDQNVINSIVVDFLHSPFRSVEEPLDVVFGCPGGVPILPFSVGISNGCAKTMAALSIVHAAISMPLEDAELKSLAPELLALCVVKAVTDPATDVFDQIKKTIGKKIRVSERSRPNPVQMEFAFGRVVADKQANGDKRSTGTILAAVIKEYNASQPAKGKLNSDEREAVLMLHDQVPEFKELLKAHWRNFPVASSGVPVSFLASPWLSRMYEPTVRKADNQLHYQVQSPSPEKNYYWLRMVITRFQYKLKELAATGQAVNLRGACQGIRKGTETDSFFHSVGLYVHFEAAIHKCCGVLAVQELEGKFFRGALERELTEKVKARDPALTLEDFRFVQAAMDYDPTKVVLASTPTAESAASENQTSALRLDFIVLKDEQEAWKKLVRELRAFQADNRTKKTEHLEAHLVIRWCTGKWV